MIRALYDWTMRQAESRHALWALAVVSFVESSIFPIPPDVLMIPMILAAPRKAWLIALVAMLASVAGGVAGYAIGSLAYDTVGLPILEFYGKAEKIPEFQAWFDEYGAWAVLFAGVTPFPYKVITIASGFFKMHVGVFIVASVIARSLRFFLIAALLWKFGAPIRDFIEKRLGLLTVIFFVLLFGGFLALKYLL